MASLSSLSKSIIIQAETEVTAEKNAAPPISQAAYNLLTALDHFDDIFFAKLVQRVGGWPVPLAAVPLTGITDPDQQKKLSGFRKNDDGDWETAEQRVSRVAGIMRVYFGILKHQPTQPLGKMFKTSRYWTWFARLLSERRAWEEAMTAELIYSKHLATCSLMIASSPVSKAALNVMGDEALVIWGTQFVKMLELVYLGIKDGFAPGKFLGGETSEGKAARIRVELEIERILGRP
jgi:nucleoporin GLE1